MCANFIFMDFFGIAAGNERGSGGVDTYEVQLFIALQVHYKRLSEVCRDLNAALLSLSYSLRLANINQLQVLIQFWCAYITPCISFFKHF